MFLSDVISGARCDEPGLGENSRPPIDLEEEHSDHDSDFHYFGDIVLYKCLDGFEFGYSTFLKVVCGAFGVWSDPPPKCHSKSMVRSPIILLFSISEKISLDCLKNVFGYLQG